MTALVFAALLAAPAAPLWGVTLPAERRHVYDLSEMLTLDTRQSLERRLESLQSSGRPRIVVLALKQPSFEKDWYVPFEAEVDRHWNLGGDRQTTTLLYVYCGWSFQHILAYGRPIPKATDDALAEAYRVANAVIQRDRSHDRAVQAALDAMEAVLAGRPVIVPTAPPYDAGASGWVKDEAGLLAPEVIERLNGLLAGHEKATSNQVVVLTVASLEGNTVDAVALRRATDMKIGQKGRDNGVLLLVASNERQVRIEVGYGLEGVLPDARAAQIIRYEVLPRFRVGDLPGGIEAGVHAILGSLAGSYSPSGAARATDLLSRLRFMPRLDLVGGFLAGLFGLVVCALVAGVIAGTEGGVLRWLLAGVVFAVLTGLLIVNYPVAAVAIPVLIVAWLRRGTHGRRGRRDGYASSSGSASDWRGSSGGSTRSSSSFSGGGGRFGGGGASGSW